MSIERIVLIIAGFTIVLSAALSHWHHAGWLYLTTFVGFNLMQAAFTGFCPLAKLLKAAGKKPGAAFG